jgi:ligand-binding sensor domain-containing protein
VPSSSFRIISAAISIFLLAALVTVIFVAIRDNPSTALSRVTPTRFIAEANATSAEATLAAAPTLSAENIEAVTPTPTGSSEAESTSATSDGAISAATSAPTTLPLVASETPAGTPSPATTTSAKPQATGIVIPQAATATPEVTPIAPTFNPDTGPTVSIYSNGNFVNGIASLRSTLWAATSGGVVAWNKSTGSHVKFTTIDGLAANQTVSAVVCPLPGLGILFAGPLGIQIFDTQDGSWKTLNSSNSTMRYDDVSTLWCSAEAGLLVVGYTRQGIDLFNARAGVWTYVGSDEGLDVSGIRDIAVVDGGATIWLATQDGLIVYGGDNGDGSSNNDGNSDSDKNVKLFTTDNSPLVDNRIEAIAADGAGAIWLTSGDTLYRTDGEEWDTYGAGGGDFPSGRLTGLDVSSNGTIWIGSDQTQLCRFDPGVKGCISFYREQEGMAAAPLTSLTIDSDGEVYYTTAGGGISIFDGDSWQPLVITDEVAPGNSIRNITQADDGAYWLAGNGGASRFIPDSDTPVQTYTPANSPLPSTNVHAILPTAAGVWFGTEAATFFDGATWTTYGADEGLTGSSVQAITADAQNRIWLGTNAGLSIWTGTAFFNLTSSNGLPSEDITALQTDGSAVWIGTRGGGLLRFQDNQLQLFNRNNSNLPGDTIYALARIPDGDLLIASDQGLARYADSELSLYPGVAGEAIIALAVAPSGEIWVATALNELLYFNGVTWTPAPTDQLPAPEIDTLMFDKDGSLWIGSAQGGLARYTP